MKYKLHILLAMLLCVAVTAEVRAQHSSFTYQGRLADNGAPAGGIFDLRFTIYDLPANGTALGARTNSATLVNGGLFTVNLDLGASLFDGSPRWLEIAARTNGGGAFSALSPRQAITATPYAITASNLSGTLPASQLTGTLPNGQLSASVSLLGTAIESSEIADGTIVNADIATNAAIADTKLATISTAGKVADSALSTNVSKLGTNIDSAEITDGTITTNDLNASVLNGTFWKLGGNAGTTPGTHFIGTTDFEPLEIRASGVGIGINNPADRLHVVGQETRVRVQSTNSTYAGYIAKNTAAEWFTGVLDSEIAANGTWAIYQNDSEGGSARLVITTDGKVAIGTTDPAGAALRVAGSIKADSFLGMGSTLMLGTTDNQPLEFKVNNQRGLRLEYANDGTESINVIGGYSGNSVANGVVAATIAGGGSADSANQATADFGTVSGGGGNAAGGVSSTVGGGASNAANGGAATVAGGQNNAASAGFSGVGGGFKNQASGDAAAVPGGSENTASGFNSFAAGRHAKAIHDGAFVWADSQGADFDSPGVNFESTGDDQFSVRATGGARIFTGGTGLNLDTGTVVISGSAQTARFGDAANIDFNPLTSLNGLLIEQGNSESSGIFFDGDSITMWSPGDNNRLFRILDEDAMGSGAAAAVRFAVDGAGGIFCAGDVGIRTDTPDRPLTIQGTGGNSEWLSLKNSSGATKWHLNHFNGGLNFTETDVADNRLFLRAGGNVGIGTATPNFRLEVNGTAGKPGGGTWSVASDMRLKKNVADLHGSLDRLLRLRSVSFEYKDPAKGVGPGPQIGFIAQEVREVLPQWVTEGPDGMLAVSVTGFESLTVDALRELRAEKDQQIGELKSENAELKQRLEKLEQLVAQKLNAGAM